MSTFDGILTEFPDIRVDFFRHNAKSRPSLAGFLSHVHSDHLAGLESLRAPFVYCSLATREILLKLEKYPCRLNLAKGILECRLQTYKHLKHILKPIPLETPTVIELSPGNSIQVTLFDANHCPGSVMFLFEGNGKAVLYTGDIRSEAWLVSTLSRTPSMVEYAYGLKTLDKIYIDTSFIENIPFQSKAEGIAELIRKVLAYPEDTIFHLQAWTYGYEDVWIALAKALKTKIHVDEYKMRIYSSLMTVAGSDRFSHRLQLSSEAPALAGFVCGNTLHPGCLTRDETVRLHSCEKGSYCSTILNGPVVWIRPIIAHLPGGDDLAELGVGGGGDDLKREAELNYLTPEDISSILQLLSEDEKISQELRDKLASCLQAAASNGRSAPLNIDLAAFGEANETSLKSAMKSLTTSSRMTGWEANRELVEGHGLPRTIHFPYSRHSSYPELCLLVDAFKPRDVWPCTVNPAEWIKHGFSIRYLFGQYCSGDRFEHDLKMDALEEQFGRAHDERQTQEAMSQLSAISAEFQVQDSSPIRVGNLQDIVDRNRQQLGEKAPSTEVRFAMQKRDFDTFSLAEHDESQATTASIGSSAMASSSPGLRRSHAYVEAYHAMARNVSGEGGDWTIIGLISTGQNHTSREMEL